MKKYLLGLATDWLLSTAAFEMYFKTNYLVVT